MNETNVVKIESGKIYIDDKEIKNLESVYITDQEEGISVSVKFVSKGE